MGSCTSSVKRRQKQHRQLHKRPVLENSTVLDNKQLSSLPFTISPNQHPHSSLTNFDAQSSLSIEPNLHQTDTSSLIQLYSSNTNNNNNSNIHNWMSSSSSSTSNVPPRIPVPKSRLPAHQPPSSSSTTSIRPKNISTTVGTTNPTGSNRPMSITNRASLLPPSQNTTQPRFGFIPRPTAPGLQQPQTSSLAARSRSISPASTVSANSSSSSVSQRLSKTQTVPKPNSNRSTAQSSTPTNSSKPKPSSSPRNNKHSPTIKSTTTNRLHSNATSSTATPPVPPTKTDVNAIRDRYKTQKRMGFFTRRTPTTNSLKSPSIETSVIKEEKNEQSSTDDQITSVPTDSQHDDLKTESSQQAISSPGDSAYASIVVPVNRPLSAQHPQADRQRQRVASTLSSSSRLSDILNQDVLLDDDNCSLKSDDFICDYEETLTLDSASKNDQTDSCSSNSLSIETNKKPAMITTVTTTKPNISPFQPVLKDHRSTNITKSSVGNNTNDNLRESLDELSRLSTRKDGIVDNEHHRRLLTRSVSLKPPPASLPPREDAEQITMDIESYRQVMKDVMVVKTILHQLDRLLKHSDGANMTDSMIGSFHESMISSRHFSSSSGDGNLRNFIDENSSYDDLFKEILILRKEREQDKQTIKLLQEQMYKYSSQPNDA